MWPSLLFEADDTRVTEGPVIVDGDVTVVTVSTVEARTRFRWSTSEKSYEQLLILVGQKYSNTHYWYLIIILMYFVQKYSFTKLVLLDLQSFLRSLRSLLHIL